MPKAVIFDVDGTLIDSVDPPAKSWQDAFGEYGREIPFDDIRSQIGNQLMPVFLSEYDIEAFGEELEERWGVILKERYLSTRSATFRRSRRSRACGPCSSTCGPRGCASPWPPRPRETSLKPPSLLAQYDSSPLSEGEDEERAS